MSENNYIPNNGDSAIDSCLFCSEQFESAAKIGEKIKCPECNVSFKLSVYGKPAVGKNEEGE